MMTITYEYGGALYVNLTNRCDCACVFCLRHNGHKGSIYADDLWLDREPSQEIAVDGGEILWITPDGARLSERFTWEDSCFSGWYFNRRDGHLCTPGISRAERQYLRELKNIASYLGYSGEEIDALLAEGWSTDEIEEAIYG